MKKLALLLICLSLLTISCEKKSNAPTNEEIAKMEKELKTYATAFEDKAKVMYKDVALAYFTASVQNTPENWKKLTDLQMKMNELYSDKATFKKVQDFRTFFDNNGKSYMKDTLLARQLEVFYLSLIGNQVDTAKLNAVSRKQAEIETKYANFRAKALGKELSDNDVEDILQANKNSKQLQEVWEAHKLIGPVVAEDIKALVKMRNGIAKELGYTNYHTMSLTLSEQDPQDLEKLFDELDVLTRDAYAKVKSEIDIVLAKQNKIKTEELMPWHYQNRYFQEAPKIFDVDLDKYYVKNDVVKLTEQYYSGIGMDIKPLIANSDLYEKPGKNQHAYCIDIDRDAGDIRVLCNVKNNTSWMETMLHEYGHATYSYYHGKNLPWLLKSAAHIFTTEAVAMFFGRLSTNPDWIQAMTGIKDKDKESIRETCSKQEQYRQLVFSRWVQVMYRFEKSMYANPDQDLNKLWWDLVEKYQLLKRPSERNMPDWATKIHIATSPCYYHNYLLGELLASQFRYSLTKQIGSKNPDTESFVGNKKIGDFFISKVFAPGARYKWNDMIERATGEKLTPKYYAMQYVK
jgi:peptidyl-dipeptidase A